MTHRYFQIVAGADDTSAGDATELKWEFGYPAALLLMLVSCLLLYWFFKKNKWL